MSKPFQGTPSAVKSNIAMPVAMAVIGASVVLMVIMLLTNDSKSKDGGNRDVENYDVVGNMPFIFGAGE